MSTASTNQSDYSMLSRRWSGTKLITGQIAVEIARLVHKQCAGQADLERNEPLSISEHDDTWVISGATPVKYDPSSLTMDGALQMRVSQFDGQILSYVLAMTFPTTEKMASKTSDS